MKTQEQNRTEVMNYLNQSSKHIFQSEDGTEFQTIVKRDGKFIFVKNNECREIDVQLYLTNYPTSAKTVIKRVLHPTWDVNEKYHKGYGMGPGKKPKAVKHYKSLMERIKSII